MSTLAAIPGIKYLSVTSRNSFLWKIEQGKAKSILDDDDVIKAINDYKEKGSMVVFQEGFASSNEVREGLSKQVDAVIISEELLTPEKDDYFKQ